MPIINLIAGGSAVTQDPLKVIPVNDTWTVSEYGPTWVKLSADNNDGTAILSLAQGVFLNYNESVLLQEPGMFGGIAKNNDANQYAQVIQGEYAATTTMPNQQTPLANYVYCPGEFILKVLTVIDNNNIICEISDIAVISGVNTTLLGISTNSYPLKSGSARFESDGEIGFPGKPRLSVSSTTIEIEPNNYGEIEPFFIKANSKTATLIYNE
jgi:hypothetical protein